MDISQIIENIMDGKYYQRGSIEKNGNMQINSENIKDDEITIIGHLIRHTTLQLQLIEGKIGGKRPVADQ